MCVVLFFFFVRISCFSKDFFLSSFVDHLLQSKYNIYCFFLLIFKYFCSASVIHDALKLPPRRLIVFLKLQPFSCEFMCVSLCVSLFANAVLWRPFSKLFCFCFARMWLETQLRVSVGIVLAVLSSFFCSTSLFAQFISREGWGNELNYK